MPMGDRAPAGYDAGMRHPHDHRTTIPPRARRIARSVAVAALCLMLAHCDSESDHAPGADDHAEKPDARVHTYTVRGRIDRFAPADHPDGAVYIRHEAIPDFVNPQGEVVGMQAMTMPFPVDPSASMDNLAEGDPVEFTFELNWAPGPDKRGPYRITEITKLPADTALNFDAATDANAP